jgi:hypothetical protein
VLVVQSCLTCFRFGGISGFLRRVRIGHLESPPRQISALDAADGRDGGIHFHSPVSALHFAQPGGFFCRSSIRLVRGFVQDGFFDPHAVLAQVVLDRCLRDPSRLQGEPIVDAGPFDLVLLHAPTDQTAQEVLPALRGGGVHRRAFDLAGELRIERRRRPGEKRPGGVQQSALGQADERAAARPGDKTVQCLHVQELQRRGPRCARRGRRRLDPASPASRTPRLQDWRRRWCERAAQLRYSRLRSSTCQPRGATSAASP